MKNRKIAGKYFSLNILILPLLVTTNLLSRPADSLAHYITIAARNNPGVLQRYDEYRAALEKAPQAARLPDPRLDIGVFLKPMELPGGDQVAEIKLMQMFPWFGTLRAAKDEASKTALAKFESYREAQFRLRMEVKTTWYQVYRNSKEIEISKQNLEYLKVLERLALVKMKTGQSSPTPMSSEKIPAAPQMANVLRIRIDMLALENRLALLHDRFHTEQARLNRTLGRPLDAAIALPDTIRPVELPASLESLADSLSQNPMVKMNLAEKEAYEAKIKMASRMGWPMMGIGINYMVFRERDGNPSMMNGNDMLMPMVSLTLPIHRKKYGAMRREAAYLRDAAARGTEDALLGLQLRYREALQTYHDAGRRIEMYAGQADLARQSVELLTAAFASGGDNFDALLQLQQDLLNYEFKEVEALVDRNTAVADLEALGGFDAGEWKEMTDEN